jgi:hypothetical protein
MTNAFIANDLSKPLTRGHLPGEEEALSLV